MDQHTLSLELLKKRKLKEKEHTLFLKRKRNHKEKLKYSLDDKLLHYSGTNKELESLRKKASYKQKKLFSKNDHATALKKAKKKTNKNLGFYLGEKGQILMEGLFFIIFVLSFLLAVQFFQSLARTEIQKERLTKQKSHKTKKAPWLKTF